MDDEVARLLEAEFGRLRIGSGPVDVQAVFGDPPWLYPPEFVLEIARTLLDGVGAVALGQALAAARACRLPQ